VRRFLLVAEENSGMGFFFRLSRESTPRGPRKSAADAKPDEKVLIQVTYPVRALSAVEEQVEDAESEPDLNHMRPPLRRPVVVR
jgi:hypothetical protein